MYYTSTPMDSQKITFTMPQTSQAIESILGESSTKKWDQEDLSDSGSESQDCDTESVESSEPETQEQQPLDPLAIIAANDAKWPGYPCALCICECCPQDAEHVYTGKVVPTIKNVTDTLRKMTSGFYADGKNKFSLPYLMKGQKVSIDWMREVLLPCVVTNTSGRIACSFCCAGVCGSKKAKFVWHFQNSACGKMMTTGSKNVPVLLPTTYDLGKLVRAHFVQMKSQRQSNVSQFQKNKEFFVADDLFEEKQTKPVPGRIGSKFPVQQQESHTSEFQKKSSPSSKKKKSPNAKEKETENVVIRVGNKTVTISGGN